MTKKDFEIIAETLRQVRPSGRLSDLQPEDYQWQGTVAQFSNVLSVINPRFDVDKFVAWCNRT